VLEHYEEQTDEEAAAEDEGFVAAPTHTAVHVPVALVPEVRRLIAKHRLPDKQTQPARRRTARG
jgi:hypothetical protein